MKDQDMQLIWESYSNDNNRSHINNETSYDPSHILDFAMNQMQEGGADLRTIRRTLMMISNDSQQKEYLASDQFVQDLEAKLDLSDQDMNIYGEDIYSDIIYRVDLYNGNSQQLLMTPEIQEALDHYEQQGGKKTGGATVWMGEEELFLKPNKHK